MKKTLLLLTLMLLGISSMSAQTLIGKWKADKAFSELVNDDSEMHTDLILQFTAKNLNLQMLIEAADEEMSMKIEYTIPGTYTKKGKQVTANYSLEKATFKLLSLTSTDPELEPLLKDPTTKKMVYDMVEEQAKKEMQGQLTEMYSFTDLFKEFTVESLTATKLNVTFKDSSPVGFDRTN